MLEIDLTRSDKELAKFAIDACEASGTVKSVNIFWSPTSYALAMLVDQKEASLVAGRFGQSTFDGAVIIPLKRI